MALTEQDILDRHTQSLKEALDHCQWLGGQQDECNAAPRGGRYVRLRRALDELEGSCRQMAHFRGDARWVKLGTIYAKAMQLAQRLYIGQRWGEFGKMTMLFAKGLHSADQIANRRTGTMGTILPGSDLLPGSASNWIILPDWSPFAGMTARGVPN